MQITLLGICAPATCRPDMGGVLANNTSDNCYPFDLSVKVKCDLWETFLITDIFKHKNAEEGVTNSMHCDSLAWEGHLSPLLQGTGGDQSLSNPPWAAPGHGPATIRFQPLPKFSWSLQMVLNQFEDPHRGVTRLWGILPDTIISPQSCSFCEKKVIGHKWGQPGSLGRPGHPAYLGSKWKCWNTPQGPIRRDRSGLE